MKNPSVNSIVERLEPCPFCGPGNSIVECYQDDYGYWKVGCGACGSHSGIRPKSDPDGRAKVVAHWNTRPAATIISELQAENERLRAVAVSTAAALGNGAALSKESSLQFIELLPGEVAAYASRLRSSLSRIRGQTIELTPEMALAGARSIGNTADTDNHVQRARECWDAMMLARQGIKQPIPQGAAIRSLDKNCSGKTDAERGSTQKEGSR